MRSKWPPSSHMSSFTLAISFFHLQLDRGREVIDLILLHKQGLFCAQWSHSKFWKKYVREFTNYVCFPEILIVSTLKTQFVNEREKFKDRRIETGSEETFPKLFYCNNKHNFGRCVISWHKRITHSYELNLTFWQTIKLNEISMYISRD